MTEASTIAPRVDHAFLVMVIASTALTLTLFALLTWFSIRFHESREVDRSNPPVENNKLEIAWTSALTLSFLACFFWGASVFASMRALPLQNDSLRIDVLAKQWVWKFQHPTGRREIDHLTVPLGRPVVVRLHSDDVIHSFYVPAFRLKGDAVPGRDTTLWFQATELGEFRLACAEYCGTSHARMDGVVEVVPADDYDRWAAQ